MRVLRVILLVVTGYSVRVDVCGLFNDMNEIILDVNLMIPDIRDSLRKRCADTRILRKGKICY